MGANDYVRVDREDGIHQGITVNGVKSFIAI